LGETCCALGGVRGASPIDCHEIGTQVRPNSADASYSATSHGSKGRVWTPSVRFSKSDHLCRGCGKEIIEGRTHCGQCAVGSATERLANVARVGRQTANGPQAQLKRANTQRQNALAQPAWEPSDQPAWLTEKFYSQQIQPLLASMSASAIARHISVSRWYAGRLREGYRPHTRHWRALAELVGVSAVCSES
jgi:hypothetical protein